MTNQDKIIMLKSRSKNFTSASGREIYKTAVQLLDKYRHTEEWEAIEVTTFISKNSWLLKTN